MRFRSQVLVKVLSLVAITLPLSLSLAACAGKEAVSEDFSDLAAVDAKSDSFSRRLELLGSLAYGQSAGELAYDSTPRYRGFEFQGTKGDDVEAWVRSDDGDAVGWILDSRFRILGVNDDADGATFDSHVTATLKRTGKHYLVFREYGLDDATFSVELLGPTSGCTTDADCAGIAVEPDHIALCNVDTAACEVLHANAVGCGGRSINPHGCPSGWECMGAALAYDGQGVCYKHCGGITARPCPTGLECADHPYDDCDPADGGADCGGICLSPGGDCRLTGCDEGSCGLCWGGWTCLPEGAVC